MSDHERVSDLFLRACELPPEDRAAFLERECGGDRSLLAELKAMLEEDARDGGTEGILGVVGAAAEESARVSPSPRIGATIGPYRIVERIGEGGMGVVLRAVQENPIRRVVALKLIRGAYFSAETLARFDAERRTLALLDHPNIARVLDAGSTPEGQPWFAMELVDGRPIGEYCRARALDVRERVAMFREVCRAIRHAHRRGVIHRDLKPSNVLVTETGGRAVPKVIDFSIAKVMQDSEGGPAMRTRTGQVIGTLEYMSPEQARGETAKIDTRTDVYSLGVLLYELLTERLPHDLSTLPLPEAVHLISTEPPLRLQTRGTTGGRIDSDLATIVEKCLEKDPERRYGSAAELAEDLDRHLEHRPILARPPSTLYQARKLVARHRVAAGVLALVMVFLVVLGATMTVQVGIQRRERLRAEAEARKATEINSFLQEMLAAANVYEEGKDLTVRQVLERAAPRAAEALAGQPEVLGEVESTIGRSYQGIGLPQEALPHLEKALELKARVLGENDPAVAQAHTRLAGSLSQLGRTDQAEPHAVRALELRRAMPEGDPLGLADSLIQVSDLRYGQSRFEEALALMDEALSVRRRALGDGDWRVGEAMTGYAVVLIQLGRLDEADGYLRQAVELHRRVDGDRHPRYLAAQAEIGFNLYRQGRSEEAVPVYEEVLDKRIAVLGPDHMQVALIHNNLGIALLALGRCGEAEEHAEQALRTWRERLGDEHIHVGVAWRNLGQARGCLEDYAGAQEAFESAFGIFQGDGANLPPQAPEMFAYLGGVSAGKGDLDTAEAWLRRALRVLEEREQREEPAARWPLHQLASVLLDEGRSAEAEPYLREAILMLEAQESGREEPRPLEEIPDWAIHATALGRCLAALGRGEEGEALMERARAALLSELTQVGARRWEMRAAAAYYAGRGDPETAASYRSAVTELNRRAAQGRGSRGS